MKRFSAILFAVLYITLTSGFAVNVHYCMGKLASVDLQEAPADHCGKCGKSSKGMDCCKDEFKFCKVTESHQAAKALQAGSNIVTDMQLPVRVLPASALPVQETLLLSRPHDPPDIPSAPIFLRNCTFLI
ncbi:MULTISPECIES: HYC_CC_PP family protein [unclassified Chitinophaga]|uniref:HYC_CC_PP family protein n=1 Tax=unclassified Chitinophaga TaxID=2619133 RepID=UPI00301012C7